MSVEITNSAKTVFSQNRNGTASGASATPTTRPKPEGELKYKILPTPSASALKNAGNVIKTQRDTALIRSAMLNPAKPPLRDLPAITVLASPNAGIFSKGCKGKKSHSYPG